MKGLLFTWTFALFVFSITLQVRCQVQRTFRVVDEYYDITLDGWIFKCGINSFVASILNQEEQDQVTALVDSIGQPTAIGLRSSAYGSYNWVDAQTTNFTHWENNVTPTGGTDWSVIIKPNNGGRWTAAYAPAVRFAICVQYTYPPPVPHPELLGGTKIFKCYPYSTLDPNLNANFDESLSLCSLEGGTLATFGSALEIESIRTGEDCGSVNFEGNYWFGLRRQNLTSAFRWTSPEAFGAVTRWASGQPSQQNADLCVLTKNALGTWYSVACSLKSGRICMFPGTTTPSRSPSTSQPSRSPTRPTTQSPTKSPVPTFKPSKSPTTIRGEKVFHAYTFRGFGFDEAREFCSSKVVKLGAVNGLDDIEALLPRLNAGVLYWLGLMWDSDKSSFYWVDGSDTTFIEQFIPFESETRACIETDGSPSNYTIRACPTSTAMVICQEYVRAIPPEPSDRANLEKFYILFNDVFVNWFEAISECLNRGLYPPTILNNVDQAKAVAALWITKTSYTTAWISLRLDQENPDKLFWADGTPLGFNRLYVYPMTLNDKLRHDTFSLNAFYFEYWSSLVPYNRLPLFCHSYRNITSVPTKQPTMAPTSRSPTSRSPTSTAPTKSPTIFRTKGFWLLPKLGIESYEDADMACKAKGLTVARILSPAENAQALALFNSEEFSKYQAAWIGLRRIDASSLAWVDGTPLTHSTYQPLDPTSAYIPPSSQRGCFTLNGPNSLSGSRGLWRENACSDRDFATLCEYFHPRTPTFSIPSDVEAPECRVGAFAAKGTVRPGAHAILASEARETAFGICEGETLAPFQSAVVMRLQYSATRDGNHTITPVVTLSSSCEMPLVTVAIASGPSCLPMNLSSIIQCTTGRYNVSNPPQFGLVLDQGSSVDVYVMMTSVTWTNDSRATCLGMSQLSVSVSRPVKTATIVTIIIIALLLVYFIIFLSCWRRDDRNRTLMLWFAAAVAGEIVSLAAYLGFETFQKDSGLQIAMIVMIFAAGILNIPLVIYSVRSAEDYVKQSLSCETLFDVALGSLVVIYLTVPHPYLVGKVVFPDDSTKCDTVGIRTSLCRLICFTIPMLALVVTNSSEMQGLDEWPFILALTMIFLEAMLTLLVIRTLATQPTSQPVPASRTTDVQMSDVSSTTRMPTVFAERSNVVSGTDSTAPVTYGNPVVAQATASDVTQPWQRPSDSSPDVPEASGWTRDDQDLEDLDEPDRNNRRHVRFADVPEASRTSTRRDDQDLEDLDEPDWNDRRFVHFAPRSMMPTVEPPQSRPSELRNANLRHARAAAMQRPASDDDDEQTTSAALSCRVCFDSSAPTFVLGCGHTVCGNCLKSLKQQRQPCPFCRKAIVSSIKIFT